MKGISDPFRSLIPCLRATVRIPKINIYISSLLEIVIAQPQHLAHASSITLKIHFI
jgi:hypothetical protein